MLEGNDFRPRHGTSFHIIKKDLDLLAKLFKLDVLAGP
jgi:hypothetical protein